MFAELHSDINSSKSGFLHLTGQPYCKKSRSAKVKDGIITYFLGTISLINTQGANRAKHLRWVGWTPTLDLSSTTKCDQNHFSDICKFGRT